MRHGYTMEHGTQLLGDGRTRFRVWGPSEAAMRISLDGGEPVEMLREKGDWFCAELPAGAGTRYQFVLSDGTRVPDPTSRRQGDDVHDASVVVDPEAYEWLHEAPGRPWHETVLYEVHVGALGGYDGVRKLLPHLARLGVTALELMPLSDFPGRHNWGYDGVLPYAPDTAYGPPEALKALIDAAHGHGIMMFLDVVYNHFGPDGAYIHAYANTFFSEDFHTPWGAGIDFRRTVVQDYFVDNALYWLREYRFDGLRFDAVSVIEPQTFLTTLASRIRQGVEPGRQVYLVMEHENNAARLLRGAFDAQWTDDIHHALHVLLTGETQGYYEDFEDATALLARSLKDGFSYQGEVSRHMGKPRGERSEDLPMSCFVAFIQNHDQVGNRAVGDRLTSGVEAGRLRAARAFLLLSPFIPLLFMGEEWATRRPFQFFTDHHDELAELVRTGRRSEFGAFFGEEGSIEVPDPNAPGTFEASMLDLAEAEEPGHAEELALSTHLLMLRRTYLMPLLSNALGVDGRVLGPGAVEGRWTLPGGAEMRIALNLGPQAVAVAAEEMRLLFVDSVSVRDAVRGGSLPSGSVAVWLSTLEADAALPELEFA